ASGAGFARPEARPDAPFARRNLRPKIGQRTALRRPALREKTGPMTRSSLFAPHESIEGDRGQGLVLVADHAGREMPDEYGDLGLPAAEFDRHIAYDIGVREVTRLLARRLGAPAVMA